ncbi:VOC family protein [Plantibacter sp. PA-3-X8]|uniref:VOC family protein n=1 Tax=Plantibacter TaxID=190323 RepID=UPI000F5E3130|nr:MULTISPECIES: VOC family protein [Plantibacter]AZH82661.1 VOC family protein [Plantibacter sp. PA-3-X8]MDD9151714.1 VOC family protein [Plantibacter flavus]VXB59142.1 Glyoxalase family protein [Plantibacter sp. T3]
MSAVLDERLLAPETSMGAVTLRVGDLDLMSGYYANAFAMEPLEERSRDREVHRVLGRGDTPLVRLVHTPDLPAVDRRQAGLFHTAFLFEDESSLSATVYRAAQDPRGQFVGSSDHFVSEAFYFTDPEGNGVELYTDRPRSSWVRSGDQIAMTTTYLDPNAYLQRHLTEDALGAGPSLAGAVGHVHLQVGDLQTARAFYVDALGFETTQTEYPGAIFASAGGYHHHIAMNVWNSQGAGPRAAALGLGDVSITVPDLANLDTLAARLRARAIPFDADGRSVTVSDPWGTRVTVALPDLSTEELLSR